MLCSLSCCYYLMIIATADSICTASPIFLILQPAFLPAFPTLHRIAGMEPTPFSPSALTPSLHNVQHKVSSGAKCSLLPVVLLDVTSIFERGEAVEMANGDDTLNSGVRDERGEGWNAEGYDTARRLRMVLNPFKERLAQDQEDRRRYLRRRPRFQRSLHLDLSPVHPKPTAPNLFSLFNVHKQYKLPRLPIPTLHHFVSAPLPTPFQPFIISFLLLCPHIPTLHHFVPAPLPTSSSDSRIGPQFDRFQEGIAFL